MQHVVFCFEQNQYTTSTHWAAETVGDMQAQRQLFSHSILKSLTEERNKLSEAMSVNIQGLERFVATVNPPQLLQSFIVAVMDDSDISQKLRNSRSVSSRATTE